MKVRIGVFISYSFSPEAQAVARVVEVEETSRFSAYTCCNKQLLHLVISFLPFPRDPEGLSAVSGEGNPANRLPNRPLNSHGGTMTCHSVLQQRKRWVSLSWFKAQRGFLVHVGILCTILICLAKLGPLIANRKPASQQHMKKKLKTLHACPPCLEFLCNDNTENCIKFVAIDMQM